MPGTINYPDARKRAKGRTETLCEWIERTDAEYVLDDFDAFELRGQALGNTGNADRINYDSTNDSTLPESVLNMLERDAALRARFERNPGTHADQTESGIDASLAAMLKTRNVALPDIKRALRASHLQAGLPLKRDDYYRRTVTHAREFAEQHKRETLVPLTDLGNAERFAAQHRGAIVYCGDEKAWRFFDGKRWIADEVGHRHRLAKLTVRSIYAEAAACADEGQRKAIATWAKQSESAQRIDAMLKLAAAEPGISALVRDFDVATDVFNVLNGTLCLKTLMLHPHNPVDKITKLAPIAYRQGAKSELWDRVLATALPDEAARRFFQKCAGRTLAGYGEDIVVQLHGGTRTGKGTVQGAMAATLGPDYVGNLSLDALRLRERHEANHPELADLRGKRMACVYETRKGLKIDAALLKTASGGDPITAARKYENPVTFVPQFVVWLATNHRPELPEDDEAVWQRLREIPFDVTIPEDKRDPAVRDALRRPEEHGAAILAWMVEGLSLLREEGLKPPKLVVQATASARAEMNPLPEFIASECVLGPELWTRGDTLRAAYEEFVRENYEADRPLRGKAFGTALRAFGIEPKKKFAGRGWQGVELRPVPEDEAADPPF